MFYKVYNISESSICIQLMHKLILFIHKFFSNTFLKFLGNQLGRNLFNLCLKNKWSKHDIWKTKSGYDNGFPL